VGGDVRLSGGRSASLTSVFGRFADKVLGRSLKADARLSLVDSSSSGTLEVGAAGNDDADVKIFMTSAAGPACVPFLDKVAFTRRGKGWRVAPTFHLQDYSVDLEADATLGPRTAASISAFHGGGAKVALEHNLDDETQLRLSTSSGLADTKVALKRKLGSADTLTSTYTVTPDLAMGAEWEHDFGSRTLKTSVKQNDPVTAERTPLPVPLSPA